MASAGAKCCSGKMLHNPPKGSLYDCPPVFADQCFQKQKAESLLVRQCTKTAEIISSSGQLSAGRVEEDFRSGAIVALSPILATLLSACYRENEGGG